MKRFLIRTAIALFLLSTGVFLYVLYANGFIGGPVKKSAPSETVGKQEEERRTKDLGWLNDIQVRTATPTSTEEKLIQTESSTSTDTTISTSTEALTATSTEGESTFVTMTQEEETEDTIAESADASDTVSTDQSRVRGVENLGKADALESTVYDHAFDTLILFAELRDDSVALEWSPTKSEQFSSYTILRSSTDENPYYPKTHALVTRSNIDAISFVDSDVKRGTDYYYRICFIKKEGRPGCGNILKVSF